MIVEVCANSLQSALNAQNAGADRLEICSELGVGGITSSYGLLEKIREQISIPVHVLIRPRSGDFSYSETDFEVMLSDIDACLKMGFEGIVSGVLNPDFTVDINRTKILKETASGMQFTFHRAFDWVDDPLKTLSELETIGVDNILTSGQSNKAAEGLRLLKTLLKEAKHCTIIPAAGIRSDNALILKEIGFSVIHLSGVSVSSTLPRPPRISMNSPTLLAEDKIAITDPELLGVVINTVK